MKIILADSYGFCFGVRRAVDGVYKAAKSGKITTLGPVTHNKIVTRDLAAAGVAVADDVSEIDDGIVAVRAHGVAPHIYEEIADRGLEYIDLTCPCVAANQKLARCKHREGKMVIIAGDSDHPEIVGINGWVDDGAIIIGKSEEIESITFDKDKEYFLMAQTTFCTKGFGQISDELKKVVKNLEISDTICGDTKEKQEAAMKLAADVDVMVVIGDKTSSNSMKLHEICAAIQKNTFFIESIEDLGLKNFSFSGRIGITAGASTPPATIEEAVKQMSEFEKTVGNIENEDVGVDKPTENMVEVEVTAEDSSCAADAAPKAEVSAAEGKGENFEKMLEESITSLHTGQIVKGKVISIVNGEVMVDLQYKSDGIIQKGHFAESSDIDPSTVVSPGDEIEVYVLRVNDGEGNVLLSKKRIDAQKGYKDIEAAHISGEALPGKIAESVKGGVIVNIAGVRAFVPSSQVAERFIRDLTTVIGHEFNFKILELDKSKRPWRVIAGRRDLAALEAENKRKTALDRLVEGEKVKGKVSNIANFGAFVDLDGVDGLIHVSELSWGRIRNVSEVLKEGDEVEAYVLKVDKEKGKVSLSLKDITNDPWSGIEEKYPAGHVVEGKVVRMVPFGAFVELTPGIDGLVHISQIAHKHVNKPEDELTIGQIVQVRVVEVDMEKKKVSLSIKGAIDLDYDDYDDEYDDDYDDEYDDDYDDEYEDAAVETETEAKEEAETEVTEE